MEEAHLRDRSLVYSLRDGMAWSVMVGFGEQYVGAFALFLAASGFQMGLLAALPTFLGAVSQVFSAGWTDRAGRRRGIIVPAAAVQGLLWIPILLVPVAVPAPLAPAVLIALVTLFSMSGHVISPPWNSLMGDLVQPDQRGVYFAGRNRICHIFTIASVGLAGLTLHVFKSVGPAWHVAGFMTVFGVACVARLVSASYLRLQHEPAYTPPEPEDQFNYSDFIRSVSRSNFARYTMCIAAMTFAVSLSAPFFVMYLLRDLNMSYLQFMTINCLAVLAQILTLLFWGRAADRFGNKWVILFGCAVITVFPFLLTISPHFAYIACLQFAVAAASAGFNLAASNYIFDAVSPPQRARCVAYFHLTNAVGGLTGGLLGGFLSDRLPAVFGLGSGLLTLFLISGILRMLVLASFRTAFQELRPVETPSRSTLFQTAFPEKLS